MSPAPEEVALAIDKLTGRLSRLAHQLLCRSVGTLWPEPLKVAGKGARWLKEDLDAAIDRVSQRPGLVRDAADVL